jgi:uncharacterized protein (TIGR02246 family)
MKVVGGVVVSAAIASDAVAQPNEIEQVVEQLEQASRAWMQGDIEPFARLVSPTGDFTILPPFGGPAVKGLDRWRESAPAIARQFSNGNSKVHLVQVYASSDLLVLVLDEEQVGTIAGREGQPWRLRVTQVLRWEEGSWRVVHRHADPLSSQQPIAAILDLAARAGSSPTG